MTEAEWLLCIGPNRMLGFIETKVSDRKIRLLACAIVRYAPFFRDGKTSWELLPECDWFASPEFPGIDCHSVISTVERAVDVHVSDEEWARSHRHADYVEWAAEPDAWKENQELPEARVRNVMACAVQQTVKYTAQKDRPFLVRYLLGYLRYLELVHKAQLATQFERSVCNLIREIVGNPFRPVNINATWLTANVVAIAQITYRDRDFSRMHDLGEAVKDIGCQDPDILIHTQLPTGHFRGCWLVDALLGKE